MVCVVCRLLSDRIRVVCCHVYGCRFCVLLRVVSGVPVLGKCGLLPMGRPPWPHRHTGGIPPLGQLLVLLFVYSFHRIGIVSSLCVEVISMVVSCVCGLGSRTVGIEHHM